jgi:preprotein translocase subunit SecB
MSSLPPNQTPSPDSNQPMFSIEKVYVKDLSLEIPNAPQIFLEREAPQVDIQLHHNSATVEDGVYQTVLTVTVTAKVGDKTMFLVEVAEAGIFIARNIPAAELDAVLGIACPNILFPYVREVISDLVVRAGFPPVILSPVNFEAIFQAQQAQGGQRPTVEQPGVQIITPGASH